MIPIRTFNEDIAEICGTILSDELEFAGIRTRISDSEKGRL